MDKIIKEIEKTIKEEKKEIKANHVDMLIRDDFEVNKKSSIEDVFSVSEDVDFNDYENLAYSVGYVNGLKQALRIINQK